VVALGGIYRWKNKFTVPDSVEVALEYPEGFMVRYCTMMGNGANNYAKFFGTKGTLDAKSLNPKAPGSPPAKASPIRTVSRARCWWRKSPASTT